MQTLDVKFVPSAGTVSSWITIDDQDVVLGTAGKGKGSVNVSDDSDHSVSMWWMGPPGATVTYEILHGAKSLAKGKSSVSSGQKFGYLGGVFKL